MGKARWGVWIVGGALWLACSSEDGSLFGTPCAEGLTNCGGVCVDLTDDAAHCGGCDQACPAGEVCAAGACRVACPADEIDCDGTCVDPTSDPLHCGGCGQPCLSDEQCLDSTCQCEDGWTDCDGACVDLSSDPDHCGSCNESCQPSEQCTGGACFSTCVLPEISCGAECIDPQAIDIGSEVPQSIDGNTIDADDRFEPSCDEGGAEDVYLFTAPGTNTYAFEVDSATAMHEVLSIRSLDCEELACSSSVASTPGFAYANVPLTAGESVLVAVEDAGQPMGYTLRVLAWPTCPEVALGSQVPQVVQLDPGDAVDSESLSCGLQSGKDRTFSFTAPATDDYVFLVEPTWGIFQSNAIEVRAGSCNGAVLDCAFVDMPEFQATQSIVSLTQGEPVVLAVDTGAWWFWEQTTLYVDVVPPCPAQDLGSTVPQTVQDTLAGHPSLLTVSCAMAEGSAQATYGFTAPTDGTYCFDLTSSMPVLEVRDGDCGGPVLGCIDTNLNPPPLEIGLSQGQHVVLIVSDDAEPWLFDLGISLM